MQRRHERESPLLLLIVLSFFLPYFFFPVDEMTVLKGRIEGAMRKDNIKDLCEYHFFGGPVPSL